MTEAGEIHQTDTVPGWEAYAGACSDPVFVLCSARSGSTLLRLLLDAHPDLACPPEAKFPELLGRLITLWSAMDVPSPQAQGNGQAAHLPAAVVHGVRHTADLIVGPYLARRGKKRYCDKNLGTALHADQLLRVFPEAKFICLHRHPMDVIASGIQACPWGLANYGFEPYVAGAPGNSVLALARYWADHTATILAVEGRYPGICHHVRYEDLVEDPEATTQGIFEFLGLPRVPGITDQCFSADHERFGSGDFKIWNTSRITSDSVGAGWSVPLNLLGPTVSTLNGLADQLGYRRIDENWGVTARPGDLRVTADGQALALAAPGPAGPAPAGSLLVSERLQNGLRRLDEAFTDGWKPYSHEPFILTALAPSGAGDDSWWVVDLAARKVVAGSGICDEDAVWTVIAPATAWEQVIRDGLNVGIAFRRHGMRYLDKGDGGPGSAIAESRVAMMGDLLGATRWRPSPAEASLTPATPDHA